MNELTALSLEGTQVTDAGMCALKGLRKCEQIAVGATAVTTTGTTAAQQRRPKMRFVAYQY